MTEEQKKFITQVARTIAQAKLDGIEPLPHYNQQQASSLGLMNIMTGGCFVTYRNNHRSESLRGCVGMFDPDEPLLETVESRSLATLRDHRFYPTSPITSNEFRNEILIEISILSTPMLVRRELLLETVKVGVHGIIATQGMRTGTYLPQVAVEQGWDVRTFLIDCAANKAGIQSQDYLNDPSITWHIYTATIISEGKP